MLEELPDLGDIFNDNPKSSNKEAENHVNHHNVAEPMMLDDDIYIYVSKDSVKWSSVTFIDVAPGNIGLHVMLTVPVEFTASDMNNLRIKFVRKQNGAKVTLKEAPILIRWQERDPLSGKIKLGLHFHGEVKSDPAISEILNELRNRKNAY